MQRESPGCLPITPCFGFDIFLGRYTSVLRHKNRMMAVLFIHVPRVVIVRHRPKEILGFCLGRKESDK